MLLPVSPHVTKGRGEGGREERRQPLPPRSFGAPHGSCSLTLSSLSFCATSISSLSTLYCSASLRWRTARARRPALPSRVFFLSLSLLPPRGALLLLCCSSGGVLLLLLVL